MAREDEEKTSFHTKQGTFCYEKMPFELKIARATYQQLIDNMFTSQLGINIEIYVDGMVIKSINEDNLIKDIAETFNILRKANMKLNPKKCTFGVEAGQFLGYIITNKGIQTNPKKSTETSLPFFKTLNGCLNKKDFNCNNDVEVAFIALKTHLQSLPALTIPKPGETLILYLAVAAEVISVVLLSERGNVQKTIYFVNRALQGSEIDYPNLKKVALALVHAA
ncbi:reverse transcriptase domain-containing protein [Tanacetum coccineum]|uniref:Reverse transcriptase domain-containing protein n=1 Tax=Tanacetum coccineum TaxID=301880 RepID=A0ABQ5GYZ5_9ASTR